jgi:Metallo-beta-lactamase superfamily
MDEIAPGIHHWTAEHPKLGIDVSSYWLPGVKILLDPIAVPEQVGGVEEILLSNRHHLRDAVEASERFGATIRAPRAGAHEFDPGDPVEFYDFEQPLVGGAVTPHQVSELWPDDCVLHIPPVNALAVADTVIHYEEDLRFVSDDLMGDAEAEKASIREGLRRLAERLEFEHLLLAHGTPIVGGGRERLRQFAA